MSSIWIMVGLGISVLLSQIEAKTIQFNTRVYKSTLGNWNFMASGGRRDPIAQHWKLKQIAKCYWCNICWDPAAISGACNWRRMLMNGRGLQGGTQE